MANGKRRHPTESLGVMPEVNTVHAFGANGRETAGWPYRGSVRPGVPIPGTNRVYVEPRMTQNELGGSTRRRRRHRRGRKN